MNGSQGNSRRYRGTLSSDVDTHLCVAYRRGTDKKPLPLASFLRPPAAGDIHEFKRTIQVAPLSQIRSYLRGARSRCFAARLPRFERSIDIPLLFFFFFFLVRYIEFEGKDLFNSAVW